MLKRLSYIAIVMALLSPVVLIAADKEFISPKNVRAIFAGIKSRQDEVARIRLERIATEKAIAEQIAKEKAEEKNTFVKAGSSKSKKVVFDDAPIDRSGKRLPDECMEPEDYFDAERDLPKEEVIEVQIPDEKNEGAFLEPVSEDEKRQPEEKILVEATKTALEAGSSCITDNVGKRWSVKALGWNSELSGHVKIVENKNAPASGEKIDIERDTKNFDKRSVLGLSLSYKANRRNAIEFNWANFEQDGILGLSRKFKGKTYSANANFEVKNQMYDLLWNYQICHNLNNQKYDNQYCDYLNYDRNSLSAVLGIKAYDMKFRLYEESNGSLSYSETVAVPYVGLAYETSLNKRLGLRASCKYLKLDNIDSYDADHLDYNFSLSYKLSDEERGQDVLVDLGYRQVGYEVKGRGNDVELNLKGPYMGLVFLF